MIEIKDLTKEYPGGSVVLKDVNATINEKDVVAIIGPSGCGKSTFLNCINVLNKASSGHIYLDGVDLMDSKTDLKAQRKKIGMVFQSFNLFNHLTVLENVTNPQITLLKRSKKEAYKHAMEYLKMVSMQDKAFNYPESLSGGQKQRVAIARTLAMDPEVILLDEPTSALDPTNVSEVEHVIKMLAKQGRTMMIVTHEMRLAKEISNRVFYMDDKGIYEEGSTEEIFNNPKKEKTRLFVNQIKSLELLIESNDYDYLDAISKIDDFGYRHGFERSLTQKMELLFEELCITNLLPMLDEKYIKAIFEYSEKEKTLLLSISHKGKRLLDEIDNDFSKAIIDKLSKEIKVEENIIE